jgi:hypothetical protein
MKKPREFTIIYDGMNDRPVGAENGRKRSTASGGGSMVCIPVIEKSAYNKVIKALKYYKEMGTADEFYFGWDGHEVAEKALKELGEK